MPIFHGPKIDGTARGCARLSQTGPSESHRAARSRLKIPGYEALQETLDRSELRGKLWTVSEAHGDPVLIGRSSSHFTRVARIFAVETGVACSFQVVPDLTSCDTADYAGNPALKLPILKTRGTTWFGALNICRELSRQSSRKPRIVWPEELDQALVANAQELVVQAMATEVALIMARLAAENEGSAQQMKMRQSLLNTLAWLEENARPALALLPKERDLSYLEVTLFCLVTHLEFRNVLPVASYSQLSEFCQNFASRASVAATAYRFDP